MPGESLVRVLKSKRRSAPLSVMFSFDRPQQQQGVAVMGARVARPIGDGPGECPLRVGIVVAVHLERTENLTGLGTLRVGIFKTPQFGFRHFPGPRF